MNEHPDTTDAQNRSRRPIWAFLLFLWTLAILAFVIAFMPVDVPKVAESRYVTYLTEDMQDVDWVEHTGVRGLFKPDAKAVIDANTQIMPLAPQLSWVNLNVLNGETMVWCLSGTADPEFAQIVREALDYTASIYPVAFRPSIGRNTGVAWRESCSGATYTIGDSSETDCGDQRAIGCASVQGLQFRGGKLSLSASASQRGIIRGRDGKRNVVGHEIEHIILTTDHTGCLAVPDADPSNMAPFDQSTQRSCHTPAGDWIELHDIKNAEPKYFLNAAGAQPTATATRTVQPTATATATPRPTATAGPQIRRIFVRRWVSPQWEQGCEVRHAGWCTLDEGPFNATPSGMFLQLVEVGPNGERGLNWDDSTGQFKFVEPVR
jgi:hypothetical protein